MWRFAASPKEVVPMDTSFKKTVIVILPIVVFFDFLGVQIGLDLTDAAQSGIDSVVKQAVALLKALKNTDLYSHYKAPI